MVALKVIGRILLVPMWIVVTMIWLLVKAVVAVYSFARGFVAFGLLTLIIGTACCYKDWKQVIFLAILLGGSAFVLAMGMSLEAILESTRIRLSSLII